MNELQGPAQPVHNTNVPDRTYILIRLERWLVP